MVGLGLFLLRVITALALGRSAYSLLYESAVGPGPSHVAGVVLSLLGALMVLGFVATFVGIVACGLLLISLIWMALPFTVTSGTAAGLALVTALIGPGYYSLDAIVFGLRRVEITPRRGKNDN